MTRIREVQSLRALAILLVAGYHYFAGWTMPIDGNNLYPGTFAPLFKYAYLGVELFFMVSGFVISMTLLRTQTIWQFALKRFIRLWPALFIALPLVFIVGNVFGSDMYKQPASHLWSSFSLINPVLINSTFGSNVDWVTAVLWTMWIELQFYFLAAIIYFSRKKDFELLLILITFISTTLIWTGKLELASLFEFLPWFLAGVVFHQIWRANKATPANVLTLLLILFNECYQLWDHGKSGAIWLPLAFFGLFTSIVMKWKLSSALRAGSLVFLGEISYEFYLIHDTVGVTVITQWLSRFGQTSGAHLFAALLGLAASGLIATAIYRITALIRRVLKRRLLKQSTPIATTISS